MTASEKEYLISFDPGKCIQCHGCEIACKTWRELEHGLQYRRVQNLWHGQYPQVKSVSISMACLHCVAPLCAAACPEKALSKSAQDGRVLVDETLCNGCGICADACPYDVPQFGKNGLMQKCDLCCGQPLAQALPPCVDTCPGQALAHVAISPSDKQAHEEKILRLRDNGL